MAIRNDSGNLLNETVEAHPDGSLEYWRDVPGYQGRYRISDLGRVASHPRIIVRSNGAPQTVKGRILSLSYGGLRPNLYLRDSNGVPSIKIIARLVLETFVGPCPERMEACHFPDYTPSNNCLSNLRWDTRRANAQDMVLHGRSTKGRDGLKGEANGAASLTEDSVREIRKLYEEKKRNQMELAKMFGVTQAMISLICLRRNWKHLE